MTDGKSKILIADDEKEIRDILTLILTAEGYDVVSADNGQKALDLASEDIDLYILDVNMPVMSGFAASAEIRKHYFAPHHLSDRILRRIGQADGFFCRSR